ncbi:hypothetical protein [uncultured Desulfuromonas sp.]|uniref:hypothetical protein n=1 Tax=uncultured Desulfuromonas sp. TaxID=181013 RepID=UPI002602EF6B|nr:hypothetical protein [uncultured Desulfuromonas sp.]
MERKYQIPAKNADHVDVGQWVEILEAYGKAESQDAIQVKSMRVGGKTMVFAGIHDKGGSSKSLRPHEGEVIFVVRGRDQTQFNIRFRS